jgi:4-hydroxybenzoate polyprenyltransferase
MTDVALSLPERLWIYQRERIPLAKTGLLLAVFTSASVTVSANLAHRPPPELWVYFVAWVSALVIFIQLRASDEVKDHEDDCRYRPERPIPRGLVSLRLIVGVAVALTPVAAILAASVTPALLVTLGGVWLWLGLMSAEFFVPNWLKARPFVYLVSHMAIMPLIDLFVTSAEWAPRGWTPPPALGWFLGLSFANGCVLEIGRKVWAPESERPGVETYSSLLGPRRAAALWLGAQALAYALLIGVGYSAGAPMAVAAIGLAALAVTATVGVRFMRRPTPRRQTQVEAFAGVWVFVCYGAGGFAPLVIGRLFG